MRRIQLLVTELPDAAGSLLPHTCHELAWAVKDVPFNHKSGVSTTSAAHRQRPTGKNHETSKQRSQRRHILQAARLRRRHIGLRLRGYVHEHGGALPRSDRRRAAVTPACDDCDDDLTPHRRKGDSSRIAERRAVIELGSKVPAPIPACRTPPVCRLPSVLDFWQDDHKGVRT